MECDLIIENGTVIDGAGGEPYPADIAIRGDRICGIGDLRQIAAQCKIDARGKIVAPGFIDSHTHDDGYLLTQPNMTAKVSQGITSVVIGNCGISLAPVYARDPVPPMDLLGERHLFRFRTFSEYLEELGRHPSSVNAIPLVGHTTLRCAVMDNLDRTATRDEMARMQMIVEEALEAGALGYSTGLFYPNSSAATAQEVVTVGQPLRGRSAVYSTHLRNEGDWIRSALEEAFEIGRLLEARVVLSHHKLIGLQNYGRSAETLAMIHQRRMEQRVALDMYPYVAGSSILNLKTVKDTERVVVSWSRPHPGYAGRDLNTIARDLGFTVEQTIDYLSPAGGILFMMSEDDVQRILTYPQTMIGSDGLPNDLHPHPRLWGTFPRILGRYTRELALLTLPEAIHRMTGLTATEYGLADRGFIRVGCKADITVFDRDTVADVADWENPVAPAVGIEYVFVNGALVWSEGRHTQARPGQVIRRASFG